MVFDVRDGDKRVNARLPIGLVEDVNRFLPRQVRQALEEAEIDVVQLVDLVNTAGYSTDGPLIDIHEDERRIIISAE